MTAESTPSHENQIWREFRQAQGSSWARRWRENPPADSGITLATVLSLLLVAVTDPVVWWGLAPDFFFPVPPFRLFLASLLFLPVNGWLGHTLVARWTPRDQERPLWLRAVRLAACCLVPFGGIAIVPVWRELLRRNPPWIRPRAGRSVRLTLRGTSLEMPRPPALERLQRSLILRTFLIVGSVIPFALGSLIVIDPKGILGRTGAIAFSIGLHAVVFFGLSHAIRQFSYLSAENPWARLLPLGRWSLLFPLPVFAVGLAIVALAVFGPPRNTWVGAVYSQRSDALRFPLWRQTGQAFRPTIQGFSLADFTGRPLAAEPQREGRAAGRREALARLTLLFLPPEAGLLTWCVLNAGGWQPKESTLKALLITAVSLAFGSLLLQAFPGAAEKLRWDRARDLAPYFRSGALFLPAAACLIGALGGAGAARGDLQLIGLFFHLYCESLAVFGAAYALRGFVSNRFELGFFIAWGFLYAALETLALLLKTSPDLAHCAVVLVLLAPALNLLAGLALLPSLLRPFTWRQILDRQLSGSFRVLLALLVLTAILPFCGLAAPFWISARQKLSLPEPRA